MLVGGWYGKPRRMADHENGEAAVTNDSITISLSTRFRAAMILAISVTRTRFRSSFSRYSSRGCRIARLMTSSISALERRLFTCLAGTGNSCHRFLPSLCPESILVPFWTLAVANVYRRSKRIAVAAEESREVPPVLKALRGRRAARDAQGSGLRMARPARRLTWIGRWEREPALRNHPVSESRPIKLDTVLA